MKSVVVAAMRNEGPFILEWVAWQTMLGFDDILILHNDCTDHSPKMLQKLEKAGWITTQRHRPPEDRTPKFSAHRKAHKHPLVQNCDWMFLCDVDEFLLLHTDEGTVQSFLGDGAPDMAGIAIHWKSFGDSGLEKWNDKLIHRTYTHAAPQNTQPNTFFKSFIHKPTRFERFSEHSPRVWLGEGKWNEGPNHWTRSNGKKMHGFDPDTNPKRLTKPPWITHENAQVNHYIIRSQENFEFKRGRPSASANVDRYSQAFFEKFNRNDEEDRKALAYADRFDPLYAQIRAIPGMEKLHQLCCAEYIAAMCEKRGDDPKADPRWQRHMALAAAARD